MNLDAEMAREHLQESVHPRVPSSSDDIVGRRLDYVLDVDVVGVDLLWSALVLPKYQTEQLIGQTWY